MPGVLAVVEDVVDIVVVNAPFVKSSYLRFFSLIIMWRRYAGPLFSNYLKFGGLLKQPCLLVSVPLVCLSTFTANTTSKLHVFGHDGHTFGVNGAQIGVLEQTNQVRLTGLLQCRNGRRLETQVGLEVLCNLTNETLKRQLANQQFR